MKWSTADNGKRTLNQFLRHHKCNNYCHKLHLEGAPPECIVNPFIRAETEKLNDNCPSSPPDYYFGTPFQMIELNRCQYASGFLL
ncbi:hypothetical protein M422DRAFT_36560 [Sphaerobolus stellatus SS14]|uniref:Alpha-type protein kinase domain-containing protein n=1 Tax=Sphaerobolus stellatus (strain SS14) TaxID=990650 RepID=A0A0C9UZA9_SPHS4|nr:hypothetical protein M422DRAFT_36560 [Sphaerobolus stellatus SS14]